MNDCGCPTTRRLPLRGAAAAPITACGGSQNTQRGEGILPPAEECRGGGNSASPFTGRVGGSSSSEYLGLGDSTPPGPGRDLGLRLALIRRSSLAMSAQPALVPVDKPGAFCVLVPHCAGGKHGGASQCDREAPQVLTRKSNVRTLYWSLSTLLIGTLLAACGAQPNATGDDTDGTGGDDIGNPTGGLLATGGMVVINPLGGAPASGGGPTSTAVCGNGELEARELCDDGGTVDGDGCSADCLVQDPDYFCDEPGDRASRSSIVAAASSRATEICDDSNVVGGDGCSADCSAVEDGWVCPRPGRPCVALPVCGNGVLERGETCDDLDAVSGDGCSGSENPGRVSCQVEAGFWCPAAGSPCAPMVCGDGLRSPDEQCDDGNATPDDGCAANCSVEDGWLCSAPGTACIPICGDGIRRGAEECDDGNRDNADGCNAACRLDSGWVCLDGGRRLCSHRVWQRRPGARRGLRRREPRSRAMAAARPARWSPR